MHLEICACHAKASWRSWRLGVLFEHVLASVRVMRRRLGGLGVSVCFLNTYWRLCVSCEGVLEVLASWRAF